MVLYAVVPYGDMILDGVGIKCPIFVSYEDWGLLNDLEEEQNEDDGED
jgi:hypothetical protein